MNRDETFVSRSFFFVEMFSFLLGNCLRVELWAHEIGLCYTIFLVTAGD